MAATKTKTAVTPLDKLVAITHHIAAEGWDFTLSVVGQVTELQIELFDGVLTLKADGTWDFS